VFAAISDDEPIVRMRAADAVEKITRVRPDLLRPYVDTLLATAPDRVSSRNAVENRQAGQRRARPTLAAAAGNFHPLELGALPQLNHGLPGGATIGRQPPVRPPHPPRLPVHRRGRLGL